MHFCAPDEGYEDMEGGKMLLKNNNILPPRHIFVTLIRSTKIHRAIFVRNLM